MGLLPFLFKLTVWETTPHQANTPLGTLAFASAHKSVRGVPSFSSIFHSELGGFCPIMKTSLLRL